MDSSFPFTPSSSNSQCSTRKKPPSIHSPWLVEVYFALEDPGAPWTVASDFHSPRKKSSCLSSAGRGRDIPFVLQRANGRTRGQRSSNSKSVQTPSSSFCQYIARSGVICSNFSFHSLFCRTQRSE